MASLVPRAQCYCIVYGTVQYCTRFVVRALSAPLGTNPTGTVALGVSKSPNFGVLKKSGL
jgi:hypothetical protein